MTGGDGFAYWQTPAAGTIGGGGSQYYLPFFDDASGTQLGDSVLLQNAGANLLTVKGSSLTVEAELFVMFGSTITGALQAVGGIYVNSDKFTVNAADGNTAIAGTLDVTSGLSSLDGGIDVNSLFAVNAAGDLVIGASNEFTVTAANGNTGISGTLVVISATVLSSATVIGIGIGTGQLVEASVPLAVKGAGASGDYAAKFYSGSNLAAWIREKP